MAFSATVMVFSDVYAGDLHGLAWPYSLSMVLVSLSSFMIILIIPTLQVMFNTAMHAEFIHDHRDYGFNVNLNEFSWK